MYFYKVIFTSYGESEQLILYSEDKFSKEEVYSKFIEAFAEAYSTIRQVDDERIASERGSVLGAYGDPDLFSKLYDIEEYLFKILKEKYNLHQMIFENGIVFWGWNSRTHFWKIESEKEDKLLIDRLNKKEDTNEKK